MKRSDVRIGGVYTAKVTNRLVPVRIERVSRYGGWEATNLRTQKPIRVKSAQRLRGVAKIDNDSKGGKSDNAPKTATAFQPAQTSSQISDDAVNVKPVPAPCPNCGGTESDEDGDCEKCHEPKVAGKESEPADAKKREPKPAGPAKPKRPSGLDAAVRVLEETGVPMNVKEIFNTASAKGYWKPAGRTPSATLAAALIRDIAKKGDKSRFRKCERGKFALNR